MVTKEKIIKATYYQFISIIVIVILTVTVNKHFKYLLGLVFLNMSILFFQYISVCQRNGVDTERAVIRALKPKKCKKREDISEQQKDILDGSSIMDTNLSLKESTQRAGMSDLAATRRGFEKFIVQYVIPVSSSSMDDSIDSMDMTTHDLVKNILKHGFISYDRKKIEHRRVMYELLRKVFGERGIVVHPECMVYCYVNKERMESWGDPVLAYLFMVCCAVRDNNEWFDRKGMRFLDELLT
ncbi:hypothetical protein VCUG_01369 [Vavraia culicis subsp. floridensis]|uniref:Uncharacterized protein n=1 Tax=Vavraia culicis (isolate floridensis) TaxID=948595 RepID=L2GVP4_VAVCU|nr:uncharacterized protein VCUG_01369 [Vavraia culicis subsp. floridensis]ELA47180.1 hypothetical protein VCUG_01369 [Vavraia culicis subsp. floridensis]